MKNNYRFYMLLLAIPVVASLFLGYSSGQTAPYSGSPGDSGNTCTVCHTGTANYDAEASISTDIPDSGYEFNHDYTITVSVASSRVKHGFQLTAEKEGGAKVGEFVAGTGSQVTNSSHNAVTHTYAGNAQTAWSFTWTSPATNEGEITFYSAVNAANSNNADSGDQIVTTNLTVPNATVGIAELNTLAFDILPNPASNFLQIETSSLLDNNTVISITNNQGQQILTKQLYASDTGIDVSDFASGIYFIKIVSGEKMGSKKFIKE